MKVVYQSEIEGTERDVKFQEGTSLRYLLESDNMGFSLHKTIIPAGQKGHWHYKHHLEACFCVSGTGELINLTTGESHFIKPDSCYVLDSNDNHTFEAITDIVLISVFNPPVTGNEIHREDHSYSPSESFRSLSKHIVDVVSECNSDYDAIEQVEKLLITKTI